jgi:hypothetical protein
MRRLQMVEGSGADPMQKYSVSAIVKRRHGEPSGNVEWDYKEAQNQWLHRCIHLRHGLKPRGVRRVMVADAKDGGDRKS